MKADSLINVALGQGEAAAPAAERLTFIDAVWNAGAVEQAIMMLLVGFSVVSWAVIAFKWITFRKARQGSQAFLSVFWESKRLDAIFQRTEEMGENPIAEVFRAGYVELAKLKKKDDEDKVPVEHDQMGALESIERSMRRASSAQTTYLESMVGFLATTGSTAPFIGLLGTVIGIMTSFQDIGAQGNASLAVVAPGIGGALAATAFGLFAAIPAVMAYNYLVGQVRRFDTEMQNFSADFLNIVKRHFY